MRTVTRSAMVVSMVVPVIIGGDDGFRLRGRRASLTAAVVDADGDAVCEDAGAVSGWHAIDTSADAAA
jgi:hypothetical protein